MIVGFVALIAAGIISIGDIPPAKCELSGPIYRADFVGHQIEVPTAIIVDCTLWGDDDGYGQELPAWLELRIPLSELGVQIDGSDKKTTISEDVIVSIGGHSLKQKIQRNETSPPIKFTGYEPRIDPASYSDGKNPPKFRYQNIKFFEKQADRVHGLAHYKAIKTERFSSSYSGSDVYVRELNDEKDAFTLTCSSRQDQSRCKSRSERIYPNVGYTYSYPWQYLKHADEIDQKMHEFLRTIFTDNDIQEITH